MPVESILQKTLAIPTAPFHEERMAGWVQDFTRDLGLPVARDRFGNLVVRYRRGRGVKPIAFVAHMDHPGFEVASVRGNIATLLPFGDTRGKNARGARIRAQTATGEVCGIIQSAAESRVIARFQGLVNIGDFAQWDFPAYQRRGKRIYSRALDDVAGVGALLTALKEMIRRNIATDFYAVFTRAEEVGFAGATALAQGTLLPKRVPVVSIEMSKMLPGAEQGKGYVVRLGDRRSLFDPTLTQFLLTVARGLDLPFQQRLMDGGTCEATAFNVMGYRASGVCLPLGHYHNQGAGRIAPENIHADDFAGLVQLIVAAAQKSGEFRLSQSLLKKQVLGYFQNSRSRLLSAASKKSPGG